MGYESSRFILNGDLRSIRLDEDTYFIIIKNQTYMVNKTAYEVLTHCKSPVKKEELNKYIQVEGRELDEFLKELLNMRILKISNMGEEDRRIRSAFPTGGEWVITRTCNAQCLHCIANSSPSFEHRLAISEIKFILRKLKRWGVTQLILTGGEPLLLENIIKVVEYAFRIGFKRIIINTNGYFINEELCHSLKSIIANNRNCSLSLTVSLDFVHPLKHDSFRGLLGLYERVIRGIKLLRKYSIEYNIVTVLLKENIKEIKKLYELLKRMKVKKWVVDYLYPVGRARGNFNKLSPPPEEIVEIIYDLYKLSKRDREMRIETPFTPIYLEKSLIRREFVCEHDQLRISISIDEYGNAYLCEYIKDTYLGNMLSLTREMALKRAKEHWMWKAKVNDLPSCKKCKYKYLCGGGCRAFAKNLTGDAKGCDLWTKKLFDAFTHNIVPKLPKTIRENYVRMLVTEE